MNEDDINYGQLLNEYSKHPHDTAFKRIMSRKPILIPYLKLNLPPTLSKRCDWDKLELLPTDFLDEHYQERRCDLLVMVPYGKRALYIHVLFEAQRRHDPQMGWRLLQYMMSIWQKIERDRKDEYKRQQKEKIPKAARISVYPLPAIVPMVFYNGKERWRTPTRFHHDEIVETPPGMMRYTPKLDFLLSDLVRMQDEDWNRYVENTHTFHSMKIFRHAHAGEIVQAMDSMLEYHRWLIQIDPSLSSDLFTYGFHLVHKMPTEERKLKLILQDKISKGEPMPTLLQKILDQGRQEGIQKGRDEEKRDMAQKMLQQGADIEFVQAVTNLSKEEILALQK